MSTEGLEGLYIETHNWGKSAAFWRALGYEVEFETDHGSGVLRHPAGGPSLFLAERPEAHELETHPILRVADSTAFEPPAGAEVEMPFTKQHWDMLEMAVLDPDGRRVSLQAPLVSERA